MATLGAREQFELPRPANYEAGVYAYAITRISIALLMQGNPVGTFRRRPAASGSVQIPDGDFTLPLSLPFYRTFVRVREMSGTGPHVEPCPIADCHEADTAIFDLGSTKIGDGKES